MSPLVWLAILVIARLLPLAVLIPSAFATRRAWRWSLGTVAILSAVVLPVHVDSVDQLGTLGERPLLSVVGELLIGLALGLGFTTLLSTLQMSAVMLASMAGLGNLLGGSSDTSAGLGSSWQRYFGLLAFTVFMISGGQRQMIDALLTSFVLLPPGTPLPHDSLSALLVEALTDSFCLGVRAAAPVGFCLMVAAILVAVLGRSSPALGTFGMSIAVNSVVLLIVSWASLGTVATVYQQHWTAGVERLMETLRSDPAQAEIGHG